MNAVICDACNRTIPEGSTYFVHEYSERVVGEEFLKTYEHHDLCPSCHDKIVKFVINDGELKPVVKFDLNRDDDEYGSYVYEEENDES